MYPFVDIFSRVAKNDYKIDGSDIVLEKGTLVLISNYVLQNDPEYFPEPNKFNPDRFNERVPSKRDAYFGFGN